MPNVFCVRADYGRYADAFKNGGYVAIGWLSGHLMERLRGQQSEDAQSMLHTLYREAYPNDVDMRRAQNVGQIARFLFDIQVGDIVITPSIENERLFIGEVTGQYYHNSTPDDCPFMHRKTVEWRSAPLLRSGLSIPLQNTLRSSLTVYKISRSNEIFGSLGRSIDRSEETRVERSLTELVLDRILELSAQEFEQLATELLTSIGFEGATQTQISRDGGVDVFGTLKVYSLASVDLRIQVKRYKRNSPVSAKLIRDFRGAVPERSAGAFITTSKYAKNAREEAVKPGFKQIGLIDGSQLVDILVDHYGNLSEELRDKLRLRRTLVLE